MFAGSCSSNVLLSRSGAETEFAFLTSAKMLVPVPYFEICVLSLIWRKVIDAAIPLQPDLQLQDPEVCKRENKK